MTQRSHIEKDELIKELVEALKDYITNHDNQAVSNDEMKYWLDTYGIPKMRKALAKAST